MSYRTSVSCALTLAAVWVLGCTTDPGRSEDGGPAPRDDGGAMVRDDAGRGDAGGSFEDAASLDGGVVADDAGGGGADTPIPGGYHVEGGRLYDGCGEEVVLRGVNHLTIYVDRPGDAMPEIARTGANVVRLWWYMGHGVPIAELERAIENGMIPMLEFHDSTCSWDVGPIVDAWVASETVALIRRHEHHVLVNIANEASYPSGDAFESTYSSAISRMRAAGIHVPIVVDGGRCGRDFNTLLERGSALETADPDHNVIVSAHLYDPMSRSAYRDLFARARSSGLAFIVGEFANKEPPGCGNDIDYAALIQEADAADIGWLAWSWGNAAPGDDFNTDCPLFDMTDTLSYDSLRGWGREVAVTDPASIQNTASRPYSILHDACRGE